MRVVLVNGSPHEHGCTRRALDEVASALADDGVESEFLSIGTAPVRGCIACGKCSTLGRCVFDDKVNEFLDRAHDADGFVFGTPVHYASAAGAITSFLDRAFYAADTSASGPLYLKPAAAVASARRAGTVATLDQINRYFQLAQMPIVSSCYWNEVHGNTPDEVEQDLEGLRIMRVLGHNMAWLIKLRAAGEKDGVALPPAEPPAHTNFIR